MKFEELRGEISYFSLASGEICVFLGVLCKPYEKSPRWDWAVLIGGEIKTIRVKDVAIIPFSESDKS